MQERSGELAAVLEGGGGRRAVSVLEDDADGLIDVR